MLLKYFVVKIDRKYFICTVDEYVINSKNCT